MRYGILPAAITCLGLACATTPAFDARDWSATVAERGDSGVRANVRAATGPGHTAVSINLAGGRSGGTHPWHVHTGTCASGGGIVGDAAAYPALRPGANGNATAEAHINVQLDPGQNYHVNVHRAPDALADIIGCGDLR